MGRCAGAFSTNIERPGGANDVVNIGKPVFELARELEKREHLKMGRSTATVQASPRAAKVESRPQVREGHRDTVEAIVVAFILALVVRGFEAQAFVIPTGSMAPTLMGRHKELSCPQCGFLYAVNASQEAEIQSAAHVVYSGLCVNCRHQAINLDAAPSFKGDRILVMMFPYDLPFLPGSGPPERWDVVVFRYPEEPEVSYIKRLVGLPGETIRIYHGDVFVKSAGSDKFNQVRKPIRHQVATQVPVYDDRHRPRALIGKTEWQRWQVGPGWKIVDPESSRYEAEGGPSGDWAELRYRHLVPDPEQWDAIQASRTVPWGPRATLITDFYSYNTNMTADYCNLLDEGQSAQEGAWMQPHWVGDLTLETNLEITKVAPDASVRLELVKAGLPHRCTIDLGTGTAILTRGEEELAKWETPIKGAGRFQLQFANVDERLTLVVDGKEMGGGGVVFESKEAVPIPTAADLAPVAVAVRNASVVASDLVLKRDIYYTQTPGRVDYGDVWGDRFPRTPKELFDFLSDPTRFAGLVNVRFHDYPIGPDHFFMMGDNSPCSKDSRGWTRIDSEWDESDRQRWEVPRALVTGKAFYVYWPHGVPVWPDIGVSHDFRIPFRPYFERMKWIR
jgi:signal peptidase I